MELGRFESFKDNIIEAKNEFFNKTYFFDNLLCTLSFLEVAEILKQMNKIKRRNTKFTFIRKFFV